MSETLGVKTPVSGIALIKTWAARALPAKPENGGGFAPLH
jgi:hypothetical protein